MSKSSTGVRVSVLPAKILSRLGWIWVRILRSRLTVLVESRELSSSKPDSILRAESTSLFGPTDRRARGIVRAVSVMMKASRLSVLPVQGRDPRLFACLATALTGKRNG